MRRPHAISALAAVLLLAPLPSLAATYAVTRADDPVAAQCTAGNCSLRGAVLAAAGTPESDLVNVPAGLITLARPLTVSGGVTIRGAGAGATSIVGSANDVTIRGGVLSELVLEGLRFTTLADLAIEVNDGRLVLRDVDIPGDVNQVVVREQTLGASLLAEAAQVPVLICLGAGVDCVVRDSRISAIGAVGAQATLDVRGLVSIGSATSNGLYLNTNGRVRIADSTFSNHPTPLEVGAGDADVLIERTRYLANLGPLRGSGSGGMVRMDDVEFRDNVVSDANITLPAVLNATDGVAWRINRALFEGNRGGSGGSTLGAAVAAGIGANVAMTNVTFVDNTYRSGLASTPAHAIGVHTTAANPTILWLFHATMRRPSSVPATTLGSLVSVSGPGGSVRLFNSVLDGTCLFGNGGNILQAQGSIESIGNTCGIAGSGNFVNVPAAQLGLGALADNGGFSESVMPSSGSHVLGRANTTWCLFTTGIDQRRHVRPANGIDCDVGAVERGAVADSLFANGFD